MHAQASLQGEMRELGAAITRDIFTDNPNVRWEDISGLDQASRGGEGRSKSTAGTECGCIYEEY